MASISAGALTCPLCNGNLSFPMTVKCGHSFCRVCLVKYRECAQSRVCPVCVPVSPLGKTPNTLEATPAADIHQTRRSGSSSCEDVCSQHNQTRNIYCHNDEELICSICKVTTQHKVHQCSSADVAAQQKKAEVSDSLNALTKKLRALHKTKTCYEDTRAHIQTQGEEIEAAIKEEFEELHRFLREEEQSRVKQLRQEQETKVAVMNKKLEPIKDQIAMLSATITDVERALKATDLAFLSEYKETRKRLRSPVSEPQCVRDILINYSDHLGSFRFRIWKDLTDIVYEAPITLDPNTAHANLKISKDLSCVQFTKQRVLPDNPERFTSQVCVLGAPAFTSGKHKWTIDVSQGQNWCIGVASESTNRKTTIFITPAEGFWVIGQCKGEELWAESTPRVRLTPKQMPERITVELDYDKGKVIFSNAANSALLHTFKNKFTERLFPYLSPGLLEDGGRSSSLTIRPVLVKLERILDVGGTEKHKKRFFLHAD